VREATMFAKVLGIIWILLGILWALKPDMLKRRLQKKMNRKMRRVVFGFILVFGFLLIGSVLKTPGILAKIVGVIGMVIAIRGIMLLTSKTSEKVFEWWGERPLVFFRVWGVVVFATGVMLMFVK
jgi:multisubunit Na+/H+ antiporter MnhB subunit